MQRNVVFKLSFKQQKKGNRFRRKNMWVYSTAQFFNTYLVTFVCKFTRRTGLGHEASVG